MIRRHIALCLITVLGGLGITHLLMAEAGPVARPALAADSLRETLLREDHYYARWRVSVELRSDETLLKGEGLYEIWRSGERFRIHSSSDRSLGFVNDFELSYDGRRTYLLDRETEILTIDPGPPSNIPTSLPDPTLLKFAFLDVDPPGCSKCRLTLGDLRDDDHWDVRTAARTGHMTQPFVTVRSLRADDPVFRVFQSSGDIVRIERFTVDQVLEARYDFAVGRQQIDRLFPPAIDIAIWQGGELTAAEVRFVRENLKVDQQFPADLFAIPGERAAVVWDGASGSFSKQRSRR